MNLTKLYLLVVSMLFVAGSAFAQGVTTASITGKIMDAAGEPLIAADVIVVHKPTGTTYGTSTNENGYYRIANMRVGGPYLITLAYVGYDDVNTDNVFLRLGEPFRYDATMTDTGVDLGTVMVVAKSGTTGQNAGASTQITTENIEVMPTLNRDISDFVRLTPQVSTAGGGISIAGVNNRYNAIYIDGAVNNDVFGLSSNGTNGGQTGIAPFSIDIIDQFQVVLSPYDVSLGGFAGGGINAVTKSGTNEIKGTAYYFTQNESLIGKTNSELADRVGLADEDRTRVADFTNNLYGASLGGPIIKDKLFFFANAEIRDDQTPNPFNFGVYEGASNEADLNNLRDVLRSQYGYDPGTFAQDVNDELEGISLFGKIDYNINRDHRLTLRHQYTKAENTGRNVGNSDIIRFSNNGVYFPSVTNSSALELNSSFGNKLSNNLIIGYTSVRDDRDPIGGDFPYVTIFDGDGQVEFGSEQFSTANALDQDIITLTDNFKIFSGDHTITIGTHNEFYNIYNLFIPQNYGSYEFSSVQDFIDGANADEVFRNYSLVDRITGDGSAAAADFNSFQLGFYLQDEWNINQRFTLTGGLRLDIPVISQDPVHDPSLTFETLPLIRQQYEVANRVVANSSPDGQLMWSPRVGFNYDLSDNNPVTLRGGMGIFTSRIPFVWPGAMFNNNGLTQGAVFATDVPFSGDINDQPVAENFATPSGDLNLFVQDFKYPQVFRTNLAVDFELPGGIQTTVEGIYTKTLNNVVYTNVNNDQTGVEYFEGAENRPIFTRQSLDPTYRSIYVADNTNEGYTYTLTTTLAKAFAFATGNLNLSLAYTYGDAFALNEATSSQNSSQWRGQVNVNGRNQPVFGRSDFAMGHRVVGGASYTHNWTADKLNATTISLFMDGQSGTAFSYVVGGGAGRNFVNEEGSTSRNRSLVYIPADASEINLVDITNSAGEVTLSAAQQWENLNAFIENDSYLSENRGGYADKNSNFAPFTTILDFAVRQDFGIKIGETRQKFQLTVDVFNFLNLLNNDWGVRYSVPGTDFNNYQLYNFQGFEGDTNIPTYTYTRGTVSDETAFDVNDFTSRWRMRLGVRYIFN